MGGSTLHLKKQTTTQYFTPLNMKIAQLFSIMHFKKKLKNKL